MIPVSIHQTILYPYPYLLTSFCWMIIFEILYVYEQSTFSFAKSRPSGPGVEISFNSTHEKLVLNRGYTLSELARSLSKIARSL